MKQKKSDTLGVPESLLSRQMAQTGSRSRVASPLAHSGYKWVVILIILLIGVLIGLYIYRANVEPGGGPSAYQKEAIPQDQLPSSIPANLPYLATGAVIHNFETPGDASTPEGVRKWQVTEPTPQVSAAYEDYFKKFGWEVVTRLDTPGLQMYGARKGKQLLSVSIEPDSSNKSLTTIELTVKETSNE